MNVRMCLVGMWLVALAPLMVGCKSLLGSGEKKESTASSSSTSAASDVDVSFLLSMSFSEAQSISPANLVFGNYRIAADEINVLSKDKAGNPQRLRAKGHVFIEIDMGEDARALAQEALLDKDEAILRGKPLLKRGRSVVEGDDDMTVFDVQGTKLKVIGRHHLTTDENGVTPGWKRTWKEGPNPLLPALSPDQLHRELPKSSEEPPLPSNEPEPAPPANRPKPPVSAQNEEQEAKAS